MRVLIIGGAGFVGSQLSTRFFEMGRRVTIIGSSKVPHPGIPQGIAYVSADTRVRGAWQKEVAGHDVVVNLAGCSVLQRWTHKVTQLIYDTRVLTTRNVVDAMPERSDMVLLNASAIGYYGHRNDEELSEECPPGNGFLSDVCRDWEGAVTQAGPAAKYRTVITRLGMVLGLTGGVLAQTIPVFNCYLGGPVASGDQWVSWIHIEDVVRAFLFALENKDIRGPINFCSPNPVRNKEFADALGLALSRPSKVRISAFSLRLRYGECAEVIATGQKVVPKKLEQHGFKFQFPEIFPALKNIVAHHCAMS